jgi:hypothetical protein
VARQNNSVPRIWWIGGEQLQGGFSQAESGILQDLATGMTYSLDVSGMM